MKPVVLLFLLILLSVSTEGQRTVVVQPQRYVFFLHNMWLELESKDTPHPEYGLCEYDEIITSFRRKGFIVISEIRPKGTNGNIYAEKIAKQVDSLIARGVRPGSITVIGTSKGGYITQRVSGLVKNTNVNYVFVGCCSEKTDEPVTPWYGNILSIYERTDKWISCQNEKKLAGNNIARFKEIELNTERKHGFLYKALPDWIEPASKWANQKYD
jgi:hypothetical protein